MKMSIDAHKNIIAKMRASSHFMLLDLYSGAGGAAKGYQDAGFTVVGVDIKPQPRYAGSHFVQADVLSLDYDFLSLFDVIHASPPCQQYSVGSALARKRGKKYPDLVHPTRRLCEASHLPYIIENVRPAPIRPDICLDGSMFDLGVIRPRVFETNIPNMPTYPHPSNIQGRVIDGDYVTVAGSGGKGSARLADWSEAMGIDWMNRHELREAIPPAYTHWIGLEALLRLETGIELLEAATQEKTVPASQIPFGVTLPLPGFMSIDNYETA